MHFHLAITKSREVRFSVYSMLMFQHRLSNETQIEDVNLIDRGQRSRKVNQITPTHLRWF